MIFELLQISFCGIIFTYIKIYAHRKIRSIKEFLVVKIAIVTDSTSDITVQEASDNNISILPIPVIIDNHTYLDNIDISTKQLFDMQRNGSGFPQTSQPVLGDTMALFDKLHNSGYDAIIVITLASTISGFFQTVNTISNEHPEYNIIPYDSGITVRLMGYLALTAARLAKKGSTPKEIIDHLDALSSTIDEIFVVDDLKNLVRGGRLSNASAFVGSMLQIKPLLTFDDQSHKIVSFDKVRSMKRALKKTISLSEDKINQVNNNQDLRIMIYHSNDIQGAEYLFEYFKEAYPQNNNEIQEFDPVIATHLGEKALGVTWIKDIDKM